MLLPDGAATSDMSHNYQPERNLGFNIKVSLQEAIGHPDLAALTTAQPPSFRPPVPTCKIGISP
jgi:hypothetical protein